jgi:glycosyltransferase involved in cell wall biosynthesis
MNSKLKRKLVISAINITEAGPLSVLVDCVTEAVKLLKNDWEIIVLVNNTALIEANGVKLLSFPLSKKSWLFRLYYEWWHFKGLSKSIKPDVWLSLHDITPRVEAGCQAVYCHNAVPFYRLSLREIILEPQLLLFNLFYRYLYGIGIHRNDYVVVQQEWLRQAFNRLFSLTNVLVAHPVVAVVQKATEAKNSKKKFVFIYPSLPRVFKNIELICEAVKRLNQQGVSDFEVRLTLSGTENRYADYLLNQYGNISGISFIGRQNRQEMAEQYAQSDCILFPSLLETWGLPITEAKTLGKFLLVAERPYAHETVGNYDKVNFLNPFDASEWANNMKIMITGTLIFTGAVASDPQPPFAQNWQELLTLLTGHQSVGRQK